jgi:multisubunit Na+/H+ antiporter MnhB subunit
VFFSSAISWVLVGLIVLSLAGPFLGPAWRKLTQGER